jgi:hypothetical protein
MGNSASQTMPSNYTSPASSGPSISPWLPRGPANFTTFQLPSSNSNDISVNLGSLQECISYPTGSDSLNKCISSNIRGLDKISNSYENIKYIGPGHTIDNTGRVSFGQNIQSFKNLDPNDKITTNNLIVYVIIVILYLFIMLK